MNKKTLFHAIIIIQCFSILGCGIFLFKLRYKLSPKKNLLYEISVKTSHIRNNTSEKTSINKFRLYLKIEKQEKKGTWLKGYFLPDNIISPKEEHNYNTFTFFITPEGKISHKQGAYKIFDISNIFIPLPNSYCKKGTSWIKKENRPQKKNKYNQQFKFTISNISRGRKNIEIDVNSNFDKKESTETSYGLLESRLKNKINGSIFYDLKAGIPFEANYKIDTLLSISGIISQENHTIKEFEIKLLN